MVDVHERGGTIFDLGYRTYDGPRLGRGYAVRSLVALSVRNVFGLGRGALPKVLAFGLAALAFVPAIGAVVGGATGGADFETVEHSDYFGLIQLVIVLFVAAMASELVGNDQRSSTLVLYFSRPIRRDDYVLAKVASLAIALLALTLLPQLLVFVGNWLGAADGTEWFADNASDLGSITVSSVLASVHLAGVGVAIAMFTSRRAFALGSVLAGLVLPAVIAGALVPLLSPGWGAVPLLCSPLSVMEAGALVVFDAVPAFAARGDLEEVADQVAYVGLPGWVWIVAALAQTVLAVAFAVRRYRRAA